MESSHEKALKKKVNYTGTHAHSHNKGGLLGEMKGLQSAHFFGEKKGDRKWRKQQNKQLKNDLRLLDNKHF